MSRRGTVVFICLWVLIASSSARSEEKGDSLGMREMPEGARWIEYWATPEPSRRVALFKSDGKFFGALHSPRLCCRLLRAIIERDERTLENARLRRPVQLGMVSDASSFQLQDSEERPLTGQLSVEEFLKLCEESSEKFSEVAEAYRSSVFLIGTATVSSSGRLEGFKGIATGFAVRPDVILTNAHAIASMADMLKEAKRKGAELQIRAVVNGRPDLSYPIIEVGVHPEYESDSVLCKDIGYLVVEFGLWRRALEPVQFASDSTLQELKVAYPRPMGFAKVAYPVAVFGFSGAAAKDSLMTARLQVGQTNGIVGGSYFLHNVPTSVGSNGSPVFNEHGEVIGVQLTSRIAIGDSSGTPVIRAGGDRTQGVNVALLSDVVEQYLRTISGE